MATRPITSSPLSILRFSTGRAHRLQHLRHLSSLTQNPHIYIHPSSSPTTTNTNPLLPASASYTLSYFPSPPSTPNSPATIGTSPTNPPTPQTFSTNPRFLKLLHSTLREWAASDPYLKAQAKAFASSAGAVGIMSPVAPTTLRRSRNRGAGGVVGGGGGLAAATTSSSGGASNIHGGHGSGGHTGFMHVADDRNPAAYGRIPEPEDIFGSLEVDSQGEFVDGHGRYAESGTYRVFTREGCLGLSTFLRGKVVERLKLEEGEGEIG